MEREGAVCRAVQGCSSLQKMRETSRLASVSHSDPQTFQKLPKSAGKTKSRTAGGGRERGKKKLTSFFCLPSCLGRGVGRKSHQIWEEGIQKVRPPPELEIDKCTQCHL